MRKTSFILFCLTILAMLAGCGTSNNQQGAAPTPAPGNTAKDKDETAEAQTVYKQNCIACHGDNLEGKLGPLTNLQTVGARKTKDQIKNQIYNGSAGMMAFKGKLKDDQIDALSEWLAAKK